MKLPIQLIINNQVVTSDPEADTVLVDFLRDHLGLTGTHIGCDSVSCGACTVHVNGDPIKSCAVLVHQCAGQEIRTVEGLAAGEPLHPLQQAFREHFALQCGFCTPGFLMQGLSLIERDESFSREQIAELLNGNYCRCTGYTPIVEAIYQTIQQRNEIRQKSSERGTAAIKEAL